MEIDVQLLSFIFSFGYGILISHLVNFNYNFIYNTSILYKLVINILFSINAALIYFLLIKVINNGVIHIYFVMSFLGGFLLFINKYKFFRNYVKLKKSKRDNVEKNK